MRRREIVPSGVFVFVFMVYTLITNILPTN